MNPIEKVLKFLVAALGNLIADAVQIEAAVPTFTGILGGITVISHQGGAVGQIAGAIVTVGSGAALALPKIVSAGKTAESELTQLLDHVEGKPAPAPPPTVGS